MALSRIQDYTLKMRGLSPGNYSFFSKQVESLFHPEIFINLDEFGIPLNLSKKCNFFINVDTLSEAINIIKNLKVDSLNLHPYEKILLTHAKENL